MGGDPVPLSTRKVDFMNRNLIIKAAAGTGVPTYSVSCGILHPSVNGDLKPGANIAHYRRTKAAGASS